MRNKPPQGGFILSLRKGGGVMPTLVEEAKKQGYKVESIGSGFYKITNPTTGKSTTTWEGTQYTGRDQLSHLDSPSSSSRTTSTTASSSSGSKGFTSSSSSRSSTQSYSPAISPSSISGYDPNWFRNLPASAQQALNRERQAQGLAPLPTDRPLTWEEAMQTVPNMPAREQLPANVRNVVEEAERQAVQQWATQNPDIALGAYVQGQLPSTVQQYLPTGIVQQGNLLQRLYTLAEQLIEQPRQYQLPPELQQIYSQLLNYQPPAVLSFEEARRRAEEALNPLYQQQLQERLRDVERDLIRRGLFGQMPSVPLTREEAARIENARAAAIGQLANELVGRSEQSARAAEEAARQRALALASIIQTARQQQAAEEQNRISSLLSLLATAGTLGEQAWRRGFDVWSTLLNQERFRQMLPLYWAETMGVTPSAPGATQTTDLVPVRAYALKKGLSHLVDYDPTTGTIIIGNTRLTRTDIQRLGGYVDEVNGVTYLPANVLDRLLGP